MVYLRRRSATSRSPPIDWRRGVKRRLVGSLNAERRLPVSGWLATRVSTGLALATDSATELGVDRALATVGAPRILLALSVASVDSNRKLVETMLEALTHLPSAALVIKLHPGGSDWSEVLREPAWNHEIRRRTKVIDRSPVEPLLGWADVVVVHRSTVAGEALAAECPVIVVETGEPSIASAELAGLDLTSVRDGAALSEEATRLSDPESAKRFIRPDAKQSSV